MNEAIVIAVVAALPGLVGAYFAYRQSTKASEKAAKTETLKVEAGAYERARRLYEDGIRQLEEQVRRLRDQVKDEQDASTKLRNRIYEMEETIATLRSQLINAGVELSPSQKELESAKSI